MNVCLSLMLRLLSIQQGVGFHSSCLRTMSWLPMCYWGHKVRLALRMAGDTDRPARRLADRRGREFLHGVFMRDVGVGQRHESPMAAEGTVSTGCAATDFLRRDDRPEQFSRHEAQRKTDHSDVCRVACLHAGVMGRLHGARIVCQDGLIERHKRHKGQKRQKRQPIGDAVCPCAPAEYWKKRPFILY